MKTFLFQLFSPNHYDYIFYHLLEAVRGLLRYSSRGGLLPRPVMLRG
ncbi:MAG: hypothetical protein R2824_09715 [Saprospiraceae bacterium]|nr:hypothetical protein [Lewinella sp.]